MFRAHKYRLYPTETQKVLLEKHFGSARFVYNLGLSRKIEAYQKDKSKISRYDLQKLIVQSKKSKLPWLKEVNSQSLQFSLFCLESAFSKFFQKQSSFPKFKSKRNHQSFSCVQHCKTSFKNSLFYCPKFKEGIKTIFSREFEGKIKTCTISKTLTQKYFVSILVDNGAEKPKILPVKLNTCLGIDLGIKDFATYSDGTKIANPRFLNKKLKRLKYLQRSHSRKRKGSQNRDKSRIKLAKQYEKVTNTRNDFQHKLTTRIADNQSVTSVAMEKLNIRGMLKNHRLARHIADAAWYNFKVLLKYKLEERGKTLLEIGQFEPSSKMCSCGEINHELTLKDREWTCNHCNVTHDRDVLAANNIKKFAFMGKGSPSKSVEKSKISTKQKGSL